MNAYCPFHKEDISDFCIEATCASRCLCKLCQHAHESVPIEDLVENTFVKGTLVTFQVFKALIQKLLLSIEADLNQQLSKISYENPPSRLSELAAFLSKKLQIRVMLRDSIELKLQRVIDALKYPQTQTQSIAKLPKSLDDIPSLIQIEKAPSKSASQLRKKQPEDQMEEPQDEQFQQELILEKINIPRLQKFNQDDWPWKMEPGAIFVSIFTPLREFTLLGFKQPMLYKSEKNNYQRRGINYNFGIYNKKNLLKKPIYKESLTIKHSEQQLEDRCYSIMFKKGLKVKSGKEYSIAIWSNSGFYSHYFSLASGPNHFIKFQQEDFNDSSKIKREEGVPQVISTFRAGLIPALIIDPREQE